MHLNGNIQMEIVFKLLSSCPAPDKWTTVVASAKTSEWANVREWVQEFAIAGRVDTLSGNKWLPLYLCFALTVCGCRRFTLTHKTLSQTHVFLCKGLKQDEQKIWTTDKY